MTLLGTGPNAEANHIQNMKDNTLNFIHKFTNLTTNILNTKSFLLVKLKAATTALVVTGNP